MLKVTKKLFESMVIRKNPCRPRANFSYLGCVESSRYYFVIAIYAFDCIKKSVFPETLSYKLL